MSSIDERSNQNQEPDEWDAGREERERRGNEALKYQRHLKQQIAASQQRQEEMSNANQLRMDQVAAKNKDADKDRQNAAEPRSFRQRIQAARQAMDIKQKIKDKLEKKVTAPVRAWTNRALQWAWKSMGSIFGAIFGIIWINIHVLLKWIFGEKLFCKLGEEWIPQKVAGATGEAGKTVSKSLGLVEVMALIFIDIIIFFIIVGFFAMFTDESTFKAMTGEANKTQPAPAAQQAK